MRAFVLPPRSGARPETTQPGDGGLEDGTGFVHCQTSQNAPVELQEGLFRRAAALDDVEVHPSRISVPGARGFSLRDGDAHATGSASAEAFMVGCEFAHLHPSHDGSLHLTLPSDAYQEVLHKGWGEPHPLVGTMLAFGPRTSSELDVVWEIFLVSYRFARGEG
jgi:phospholipase/carboxylesterase